jgi:2-methylisocitrate lyase-like PEP mutase family enzyme
MPDFKKFKALHHSKDLFVLPNVWNAKSALLFEEKGFPAIGTSSAAVANSLGYEDGEKMPFEDYLFVVKRILSSVKIPLTVDIEMGYGNSDDDICANVLKLAELGVVGINIEDSVFQGSKRVLKDAKTFASTIEKIKNTLVSKNRELFINIRCDTYILNVPHKQQETKSRLKIYETTGAHGIFLPCISEEADIEEAVGLTKLSINVMHIPGLPGLDTLNKLGVKRLSMGPFIFNKIYDIAGQLSQIITADKSFLPVVS